MPRIDSLPPVQGIAPPLGITKTVEVHGIRFHGTTVIHIRRKPKAKYSEPVLCGRTHQQSIARHEAPWTEQPASDLMCLECLDVVAGRKPVLR